MNFARDKTEHCPFEAYSKTLAVNESLFTFRPSQRKVKKLNLCALCVSAKNNFYLFDHTGVNNGEG